MSPLVLLLPVAFATSLPSVDEPLKTGADAASDAGVVVGIDDYYELPDVPWADRDARAVADYLVYTRGIPNDRVARVHKANREKMLDAVSRAAEQAGPSGTVWVYFAGHGGASPVDGDRLLMGIDTQPDETSLVARSVSVPELREAASAHGAKVVLLMDTCYAGRGRSGEDLLPGKRFAIPSFAVTPEPSVLEWSAASANQLSGPLDPVQHGAFTYAVLGALRGWADGQLDGQADGQVTAEEAQLYVAEALRSVGVEDQHPVLTATDPSDWVLADHPRAEPRPVLGVPDPVAAPEEPPAAPPQPVAPAAPVDRNASVPVCFRRNRTLNGVGNTMTVRSGSRALVSVGVGGQECIELAPGTYPLELSFKSGMLATSAAGVLEVRPGEPAWVLMGIGSAMFSKPSIVQVSEKQYDKRQFKLLK